MTFVHAELVIKVEPSQERYSYMTPFISLVKKLVRNNRIKAFWYTKIFLQL